MRAKHHFPTIRTEGAILPADLLERIAAGDRSLPGLTPADYHLDPGEKLNEAVSRSWNRLLGLWKAFRTEAAAIPADDPGTTLTRERWLLPLFRELGYGRLPAARAVEIADKTYPISHRWNAVPIHLLGCRVDLDRRSAGIAGAARTSPHSLLQEYLNRSHAHLWAFLANGLRLRILRDSARLTRQAYVEFDLESMMDGEVFPDFSLLWLLCHQSRVEDEKPEECLLERWSKAAAEEGARALDALRGGVERAIAALGRGFLAHPVNTALRDDLRSGRLDTQEYFRQLLRLVYRLIFLFVAEDRDLLLAPGADPAARERYLRHYSTRRLRDLAGRTRGSRHADLYEGFKAVADRLENAGSPELALKPLGSFLWSRAAVAALQSSVGNADFLDALRALAWRETGGALRPVDYRNLRGEELGSVYESLLELRPEMHLEAATFSLVTLPGHERKTSGSYYTHDSLVQCLLDSALEPLVEEAVNGKSAADAEKAILSLKACDPAVGSGHFLVAAGHRLARRLASVRTGDSEPSPEAYRTALRDVIGHCLYGVDLNPMAVELCKVSLWMEAMEPGKPLSFLDHRILCGNSLLGATPALIAKGIPDEAFNPIEGDDKTVASALKKRNKQERAGQMNLFDVAERPPSYNELRQEAAQIDALDDTSLDGVRTKETRYRELLASSEYHRRLLEADAWCAAFVWKKTADSPGPLTQDIFLRIRSLAPAVGGEMGGAVPRGVIAEIQRLAAQYRFFHWHLAFPEVFCTDDVDGREIDKTTGWTGGFDLALGNPPWDTMSPDRREFFGQYYPGMRALGPRDQDEAIDRLLADPGIAGDWRCHQRDLFGLVHFLKNSGRYTLFSEGNLGKGDFNVYRIFIELAFKNTCRNGFAAQVVPAGFRGGANASAIRKHVLDQMTLELIVSFVNIGKRFFPTVHGQFQFMIYIARKEGRTQSFSAAFGIDDPAKLALLTSNILVLHADTIRQEAPHTYTIPDVRSAAELSVAAKMVGAYPPFGDLTADPPIRHYLRELDMGNDRHRFTLDPTGIPVYEGRMISHFDHRAKAYVSGHGNSSVWIERPFSSPEKSIVPQWRVMPGDVPDRVGDRCYKYRICFRDIAQPTDLRSFIATLVPPRVICGDTVPTITFDPGDEWAYMPWLAVANSFVMDFFTRKKLSSPHLKYFVVDSLPFPRPKLSDNWVQRAAPLALRLICTSPEMTPYWNSMAQYRYCATVPEGTTPPQAFVTSSDRAQARAELDALVAHDVYKLTRDELSDLFDAFLLVKKRDEATHGEYRTKRVIIEIYDAMAEATRTGIPYQTRLDPPPADSRCAHPNTPPAWLTATAHTETPAPPRDAQEQLQPVPTVPPAIHAALAVSAAATPLPVANAPSPQVPFTATVTDPLPSILAYLKSNPGPRAKSGILAAIGIPDTAWPAISRRLAVHPNVEKTGERRRIRYSLKTHENEHEDA